MQPSPRAAWSALLGAVVLVPLVVGVIPLAGTPLTLNAFVQPKLIVMSLTLAAALGLWALTSLREGTLYAGRALIPLGAFVLAGALSTVASLDPRIAVFGDFEQGVGFLVFLLCALAFFLTTQLVRDEERLSVLTSATILTATGVAVLGLLQQVLQVDLLGIGRGDQMVWMLQRGYSTIGNPDTYAGYLVLPALLALHRLRRAAAPRERWKWTACLAAILASLVMAQTRGPIAGLVVGGVAYALGETRAARRRAEKTKKKGKPAVRGTSAKYAAALVAAVVTAGVVGAIAFGTQNPFLERFASLESLRSLGGRIPLWTSALEITARHPVFGVGMDSFRLGWYPVRDIAHVAAGAGLVITDPHSVPLLIAATMGVAGIAATVLLLLTAFLAGFRTSEGSGADSDYPAWLYGTVALSVTLLASMLTSVLSFVLFVALGVLVAPTMRRKELPEGTGAPGKALRWIALLAAAALIAFALLSSAAQLVAVGARTGDPGLAAARATRAAALAPWNSEIRELKYETMVQAALERVFTVRDGAAADVAAAEKALAEAARAEPHEYRHPYRSALLLIASGQKLGDQYTRRGITAGLRGLDVYPNSVELRTGVASGYLQVGEPEKAVALLRDLWDADPGYLQSGVTYFEALSAEGDTEDARAVLTVLERRFPQDPAVVELRKHVPNE